MPAGRPASLLPPLCGHFCPRGQLRRRLCGACYQRAQALVQSGGATWEALELEGRCGPTRSGTCRRAPRLAGRVGADSRPAQGSPLWLAGCSVVQAALAHAEALEDVGERRKDARRTLSDLLGAVANYKRLRGDTIPLPPVRRGPPVRMIPDAERY